MGRLAGVTKRRYLVKSFVNKFTSFVKKESNTTADYRPQEAVVQPRPVALDREPEVLLDEVVEVVLGQLAEVPFADRS